MADPQQQATLGASDWDSAKPVSQSDWDSAKPVTAGGNTNAPTDWLGHLWNIAKTVGSDVVDTGKDVLTTAANSGGDPVKFLVDMGAKAGSAQLNQFSQAWDAAKDAYRVAKGGAPFSPAVAADVSSAFGHTVAGATPVVGPVLANATQEFVNAGGTPEAGDQLVGHVLSAAAMTMAPEAGAEVLPAIRGAIEARQAGQMPLRATRFTSELPTAIPPSKSAPYTTTDTMRAAPYFAAEQQAMPIESPAHVAEAARSISDQMSQHMGQLIQAAGPNRVLPANILDQVKSGLATAEDKTFAPAGLKEIAGYDLDQPVTLARADNIITELNAQNRGVQLNNHWDLETALKSSPAFAARYYAADALRNGMLDTFDQAGIDGVGDMRKDWASVLKIGNAADRVQYQGDRKVAGTGATGPLADLARRVIPAGSAAVGAEMAGPAGAAVADLAGRSIVNAVMPGNQTRNALVTSAFKRLGLQQPPPYPAIPSASAPVGLLAAPATPQGAIPMRPSGPSAVPPVVGGTSQPSVFGNRLQLPAGTANGELTRTNLPPSPLRTQSQMQVLEARPILVRDPTTGRFKRVYTAEPKSGGKQ